jgi:hypothetical protein
VTGSITGRIAHRLWCHDNIKILSNIFTNTGSIFKIQEYATMNRVKQLLNEWVLDSQARPMVAGITVKLTALDYARIRALAEIYADRSEAQIISELLSAVLDEVEEALPYIPGKAVIAEDEFGDPIYEDIGLTRKFEQLKKKYSSSLQ